MGYPAGEATAALDAAYGGITAVVEPLDDAQLLRPSRCAGWAVRDVLAHLRFDAERTLIACATPAPGPPDLDFVTYWSNWASGFDPERAAAHGRFISRLAAAYSPAGLVAHWRDTAAAAVRAASAAPPGGYVRTQGHVLAVGDFVVTLVVEATIHHLDLTVSLNDAVAPTPQGLELVRRTLTALIGTAPGDGLVERTGWDDVTLALKGTGRLELTDGERARLGPLAARFPLFR